MQKYDSTRFLLERVATVTSSLSHRLQNTTTACTCRTNPGWKNVFNIVTIKRNCGIVCELGMFAAAGCGMNSHQFISTNVIITYVRT